MQWIFRVYGAMCFAEAAHAGQARRYTGEPYIKHCEEVVGILKQEGIEDPEVLAAAWLHDTVEDNPAVTLDHIGGLFGTRVAYLVQALTDTSSPADGNRAARKAIDRQRLAEATAAAQTIKLADLISNTRSIVEHDPGFARVYLAEKAALLACLTKPDKNIRDRASLELETARAKLDTGG